MMMTLKIELEQCFNISGLSKSPSIFDIKKLTWLNGEYIKNMDAESFYILAENRLKNAIEQQALILNSQLLSQ